MKSLRSYDSKLNQTIKPNFIRTNTNEENYECSLCQDRLYILKNFDEYTYSVECICSKPKKIEKNIEKSGISPAQKNLTIENFVIGNNWQKDFRDFAMDFVENHNSKWFYIGGQIGSGKSHLCVGISLALIKLGKSVRLMSWRDSTVQLKAMIMDAESYTQTINQFKKCEVLCIDDLFKTTNDKKPTDADINIASEIIDYRYRYGLTTIINSEKNINDLLEISESIGSRIIQQSTGFYIEIPIDSTKNFRLKGCSQYE